MKKVVPSQMKKKKGAEKIVNNTVENGYFNNLK